MSFQVQLVVHVAFDEEIVVKGEHLHTLFDFLVACLGGSRARKEVLPEICDSEDCLDTLVVARTVRDPLHTSPFSAGRCHSRQDR